MALYSSPLEAALFDAFTMLDSSSPPMSCRRKTVARKEAHAVVVQPRSSIKETDGTGVIEVELPGVAEENVKVDVSGGKLSVSGERFASSDFAVAYDDMQGEEKTDTPQINGDAEKAHEEKSDDEADKGNDSTGAEKPSAGGPSVKYVAVFKLPPTADVGNSSAVYKNGLLHIRIPRKESVSRTIQVNL